MFPSLLSAVFLTKLFFISILKRISHSLKNFVLIRFISRYDIIQSNINIPARLPKCHLSFKGSIGMVKKLFVAHRNNCHLLSQLGGHWIYRFIRMISRIFLLPRTLNNISLIHTIRKCWTTNVSKTLSNNVWIYALSK